MKVFQKKFLKLEYELFGCISHIGSHTGMGHYVCFIKMKDNWVKFNDSIVESCEKPPLDLGYVYFYKRK
jgi:ubiquitin carboxyl-terminal hydrolase 5/13